MICKESISKQRLYSAAFFEYFWPLTRINWLFICFLMYFSQFISIFRSKYGKKWHYKVFSTFFLLETDQFFIIFIVFSQIFGIFCFFFQRKTCGTRFHCSAAAFCHANLHSETNFIHVQVNMCDFYCILCVFFPLFCDILNSQDLEESFESNRDGSNSEGSSSGSDR